LELIAEMTTANANPHTVVDAFLGVMRRYHGDGVVYSSPVESALYRVDDVDEGGCDVIRLNKGTKVRCSTELIAGLWAQLQKSNGIALPTTFSSNRAQLSSFLQGPYAALDLDGNVRDMTSPDQAMQLLVEYGKRLRVD